MPDDFVVALNPDPDSKLPYLIRLPLGSRGVVLKARETWPRTSKVFCHRSTEWPEEPQIVERVPVRVCGQRGPAIDLVLDRGKESRSQFVFTKLKDGREAIFWQSPRTTKAARPGVRLPTRRVPGVDVLPIVVDVRERYPYTFGHQKATASRGRLPAGDYGVAIGEDVVAVVERKSLQDLASSLVNGKMGYALAELAGLPRAAVVVEERYSRVFALEHVKGGYIADLLARAQVRWPSVPIVFCETRPLAEEWTFRFLGAALAEMYAERGTADLTTLLPAAEPLPARPVTPAEIRAWARDAGLPVSDRGRLRPEVVAAYDAAHPSR